MLCPFGNFLWKVWVAVWIERGWGDKFLNITRGKCEQGFRRTAARNKPAGIRSLVYGMRKGKAGIEGLSVSRAGFERGMGGLSLA